MKKLIITVTSSVSTIDFIGLALAAVKPQIMASETLFIKCMKKNVEVCLS